MFVHLIAIRKNLGKFCQEMTWPENYFQYRICTYRTPLLIGMPECTFWAHYGYFSQLFIHKSGIFGQNLLKMTIVGSLKILNFNRMPAFYMGGYGTSNQR